MAIGKRYLQSGFSLLELIIVIALLAVIGGLVVVNANALISGLGAEAVDKTLQKAVREGRYQAAALKDNVRLSYDDDAGAFVVSRADGSELERFETQYAASPRDLRIRFEQLLPGRGTSFPASLATAAIPAIVFRPDRSSTPFQVEIRQPDATFTLRFDPFSAIVIDDSRSR